MDRDWARLGTALQGARKSRRPKLTQEDVAAELGVSRATVQNIERGKPFARPTATHLAYAKLVGWVEASAEQVLHGGEPALAEPAGNAEATGEVSAETTRLPLRIVDELQDEGALLDSIVLQLGDDARMVVVVKGRPNASPEEIKRNLEAWRKAQRHLQAIDSDEEPGDVANGA